MSGYRPRAYAGIGIETDDPGGMSGDRSAHGGILTMANTQGTTDEMVDGETMPTEDTPLGWGDVTAEGITYLSELAREIPYQIIADFHKASWRFDAAVERFEGTQRRGIQTPLIVSDGQNLAAETDGAIYRHDGAFEDDEIPNADFLRNVILNATSELASMTAIVRGMTGEDISVATKKVVSEEGA